MTNTQSKFLHLQLALTGSLSVMSLLVLPSMVGALTESASMSESMAGYSASANFMAGAALAIFLSLRVHHINLRTTAQWGFGLAALSDLGCALFYSHTELFMVLRALNGIGTTGAAYTAVVAAIARTEHCQKGYGWLMTMQFALSAAGLYVLSNLVNAMGIGGIFSILAVLNLLGLALSAALPKESAGHTESSNIEARILLSPVALMAVAGIGLYEAANTSQFAYTERLGNALALADGDVSLIMALGSLVGILGAYGTVLLGDRFGNRWPLVCALCASGVAMLLMLTADDRLSYGIASCMLGATWAFTLPYYQAMQAELDPQGTVVAAGGFASTIGNAAGPGIASTILLFGNYHHVLLASLLLIALCLLSVVISRPAKALSY